jgi:glutathione S-transferase
MKLIGMLDSPYVRRVAVSLQLLGLNFEHHSLSVFRSFDAFADINPVVKAPTLVCDDGTVLMDSTLILDYAQALARPRSLVPQAAQPLALDLRVTGLALAACEKAVQIVYERGLRPPEKLHQPWVDRVTGQLLAACAGLERELGRKPLPQAQAELTQGGVSTAVAWCFVQAMLPEVVDAARFPVLDAFSAQAERFPAFSRAPHGDGVVRHGGRDETAGG